MAERKSGREDEWTSSASARCVPLSILLSSMLLISGAPGCRQAPITAAATARPAAIRFEEVAEQAGIRYQWPQQPRPMNILESYGYGCAMLDYDSDGWQDILLIGVGQPLLFRNLGDGKYQDVSQRTHLKQLTGDLRGCAVGDCDGDGDPDLLITGYRRLALLRNDGGTEWTDVTERSGLDPQNRGHWGSSAGFMDLNGDGWLDLVLLNYVSYDAQMQQFCQWKLGVRSGCGPGQYKAEHPELWRNLGKGRFQQATANSGLSSSNGKGMVLAFADLDDDGRQDIYIGNDGTASDLMWNRGNLRFENIGEPSGVAYGSVAGTAISAMGADWADFDRDGRLDLFVTAFSNQPYSLLRGTGDRLFEHAGDATGLTGITFRPLGFGARWLDLDNDTWPDLAIANGHVHDNTEEIDPLTRYREPAMLLHNLQGSQFTDLMPEMGPVIGRPIVGRGLATGDIDNDGKIDVLVVDMEGRPLLLRNRTVGGHWITLDLRGRGPNRLAYGARITAEAGGEKWSAQVSPAASYLSSNDPRVHFGLGSFDRLERVRVQWPDGGEDVLENVAVDRILRIEAQQEERQRLARQE